MQDKSYDELKAKMEAIQQQMVEAKKSERAKELKEGERLWKSFTLQQNVWSCDFRKAEEIMTRRKFLISVIACFALPKSLFAKMGLVEVVLKNGWYQKRWFLMLTDLNNSSEIEVSYSG